MEISTLSATPEAVALGEDHLIDAIEVHLARFEDITFWLPSESAAVVVTEAHGLVIVQIQVQRQTSMIWASLPAQVNWDDLYEAYRILERAYPVLILDIQTQNKQEQKVEQHEHSNYPVQ